MTDWKQGMGGGEGLWILSMHSQRHMSSTCFSPSSEKTRDSKGYVRTEDRYAIESTSHYLSNALPVYETSHAHFHLARWPPWFFVHRCLHKLTGSPAPVWHIFYFLSMISRCHLMSWSQFGAHKSQQQEGDLHWTLNSEGLYACSRLAGQQRLHQWLTSFRMWHHSECNILMYFTSGTRRLSLSYRRCKQ